MSSRSRWARLRRERMSPPRWLVRFAWIGGLVVATTIAWLALNFQVGI